MASNQGEFLDILNAFDDVNDLMFYAQSLGLENDPLVIQRNNEITIQNDYIQMLKSFGDIHDLFDFGIRNGLLYDPNFKRQYALLNIRNYNNLEQLALFASENGITEHPAVIQQMKNIQNAVIHSPPPPPPQSSHFDSASFPPLPLPSKPFVPTLPQPKTPTMLLSQPNHISSHQPALKPITSTSSLLQCEKCKKSFNDPSSKQLHESNCQPHLLTQLLSQPPKPKHPQPPNIKKPIFECQNCNETFTTKRWRDNHQQKCFKGKTCSRCDTHFGSLALFAQHRCNIKCQYCAKTFPTIYHKNRHEDKCNRPSIPKLPPQPKTCEICKVTFKTEKAHDKHVCKPKPISKQSFTCRRCNKTFNQVKDLKNHQCIKLIKCRRCLHEFETKHNLFLHIREKHQQKGSGGQVMPDIDDKKLRDFYMKYRSFIHDDHHLGQTVSFYNYSLKDDFDLKDINTHLQYIFSNESNSFKLNLAFGFILQHNETAELRYYKSYSSDPLLDQPITISNRQDLQQILDQLNQMDITTLLHKNRPDTKWRVVLITNIRYFITSTHFPLGEQCSLPEYITRQKSIVSLTSNFHRNKYDDNKCLFRCYCYHKHPKLFETPTEFEKQVNEYYQLFSQHGEEDLSQGVDLNQVQEFEKLFNIDINIFTLYEDGTALPVFKSMCRFKDSMYLNLHDKHLSYIKDVKQYCKKYQCPSCKKLFDRQFNCKQHMKICNGATKYIFPGGFHQQNNSIFDDLEEIGIHVQQCDRFYNYFIVYDFESILKKIDSSQDSNTITTAEHIPISVSISSNVPNYTEPHCIIEEDKETLAKKMLEYMEEIQTIAQSEIEDKLSTVMEELESQLHSWQVGKDEKETFNKIMKDKIQSVISKFKLYRSQIPVLGFNSSKYDINLIKQHIAKVLELHDSDHQFVVKKNNAYSCIANESFKFLDVLNYLAGGSSYSKFLKAFGVNESKGFFPYEYFDHPDKLDETSLPPHESFYSELKQKNISVEDYQFLQKVWKEKEMKTFRDLLIWYNNLDVGPFVEAVEKLQSFYQKQGIDIFKNAISVPGIARQLVFQSANEQGAYFSLIDEKNSDLYFTLLSNIVGGPSLIFHRYAEAGKTFIRGGDKKVGSVLGLDANALYLWAFDQEFPVGSFIRRHSENNFTPSYQIQYDLMYFWLDYEAKKQNVKILHKRNFGKEKRDGRFLADGYCAETNTIYQFDGCFFHSHSCQKKPSNEKEKIKFEAARKRTQDRDNYYRSLGYNIKKIWECDFRKQIRNNPELSQFIETQKPKYYKKDKKSLTEDQLLDGVRSGELFGALEVDIEVPENLKEQFSEMCPLFCTTDIPFNSIGQHMQDFAQNCGLNTKPRRLLVGALKAKKMLIATPLLKWYLEHGLRVTKIYQVVEYSRMRCFRNFVKNVSDARRSGDADPNKSIIADLNKLIGNSAYGSMIMNKLKHSCVEYVEGETEACKKANEPTFKAMTDLGDDYFEVEMQKKRITLDLPIQIGYFILQYAKLKMLDFYVFLTKYVEKSDFQMLQMDTDSLYFSISGKDLGQVIKPHLKDDYTHQLQGLCSPTPISGDTHYFPRSCCSAHAKYDSRTPGLFKVEYTGDLFYGLCSKTYIVKNGDQCKFSSKGISKNRVKDPLEIYKSVLETKSSSGSSNVGFIAKNNTIFTYKQHRKGFSYFYCKRKVMDDGITTEPLDITVQPIPSKFRKIE